MTGKDENNFDQLQHDICFFTECLYEKKGYIFSI